ncbi:hypothetical protein ACMAZF_00550 [Psychrobium sp. nBUS_13]|jgi:hypothetical protein|uniref:hypothetical protein n=1 Tax=Psychrobium sp. nBUS_13 TaxID=3395319 RepID=UPI003EB8DD2F
MKIRKIYVVIAGLFISSIVVALPKAECQSLKETCENNGGSAVGCSKVYISCRGTVEG